MLQLDVGDWEKFWVIVQKSFSINKHVEFFRWLQDDVHGYLPHDVMVAAWGDFIGGPLNYDVASCIPEIHTQNILNGCGIDTFMGDLYQRWRSGGEHWYVLNEFDVMGNQGKSDGCLAKLGQMKSVLVHSIRDRRDNLVCLYAFFDRDLRPQESQPVLELLLPQIDAALRRIECLAPVITEEEATSLLMCRISKREHEIMNWVKFGKTNYEIGAILGISPNTVKNHLKRIFQKLDVTSRAQAVAKYEMLRLSK